MDAEPRLRSPAVRAIASAPTVTGLRPCEAKFLARVHDDWALDYGTREIRLLIEYQDGVPVLIRVTENTVREEKLR